MFEPIPYPDFDRDDVAICHELGHAVTWFGYGEPIGPMTISRCPVFKVLKPRMALDITKDIHSNDYAEHLAEHWLAGESAARKALNMRRNRISTKQFLVNSQSDIPALLRRMDEKEDFARVLWAAHEKAKAGWYVWVRERLHQATAIVDRNWGAIQRTAVTLQPRLPLAGQEIIISDTELITLLRQEGVKRPH